MLKRPYRAIYVAVLSALAMPSYSASPYSIHQLNYVNTQAEALSSCQNLAAVSPIPANCPAYPDIQAFYSCRTSSQSAGLGMRDFPVSIKDARQASTGGDCIYQGTNYGAPRITRDFQ